ncbi:glycoside hydrolase family 18 protein [Peribacillus sp. SCS-37]|uniref:glycoside hydrolase family 18 protein n=1 Tax=Paraperibacillus esterisolvens TaxID=3115296 RepID=UPI003906D457
MKKSLKKLTFLLFCLFILPISALAEKPSNRELDDNKKIIAYFPSWNIYGRDFQVKDIDAAKITHINYAFANIQDGKMVLGDPWADVDKPFPGDEQSSVKGNFGQLIHLKESYPHLKTLISVGGWTWSGAFSDAALTDESRDKFAKSAVKFLRDYQFDGVDLDWEYPVSGGLESNIKRPQDKQNYTLLLAEIRHELDQAGKEDKKHYLLTIAGGASSSFVSNTELSKLTKFTDFINIMTYDFHGSWEKVSGHNAPLFADPLDPSDGLNGDTAVNLYLEAGVPSEEIVLGIPFYGKGWDGCENKRSGEYQACNGPSKEGTWEASIFDYTDIEQNYLNKNGYKSFWNGRAKVPFLYNPSTGTFITYENEKSIGYKADYITANQLGGAMIWEISGDRNLTLLSALSSRVLNK